MTYPLKFAKHLELAIQQSESTMKLRLKATALAVVALATVPACLMAQVVQISPQQGIDQANQLLRERMQAKPLVQVDTLGIEAAASISQLQEVQIQGELLRQEIERYWKPYLGRAVTIEQIQEFHAWFNEKSRQEGFMAYAKTETVNSQQGQRLVVQTLQPKVGTVRILSQDAALVQQYESLLKQRFDVDFRPGMPLDTQGLDQRLDSVSYDLPIELDATLRAVGPELLDLIVNITSTPHQALKWVNFVEQWNVYGLRQYGRWQIMAMAKVSGLSEKSSLTMTGQVSEGIGYARAEYEDLLPALGARGRLFGAHARSKSIDSGFASTENNSGEMGAGLTRVLGGHRDTVFKGFIDLSRRKTRSQLVEFGTRLTDVTDHQFRLRLSADNERLTSLSTRSELGLTVGDYIHVQGPALKDGIYKRIDAMVKTERSIDRTGTVSVLGRIKGQWANRNLDSYNQMALGGINGVRAYTSIDGVGDRAVTGTLEINKSFKGQWSAGLFYDAGYVQNSVHRTTGQSFNQDTLQAVGLKVEGQVPGCNYSLMWAKGVGGYKTWQSTNQESKPNNHRIWAGLTFFFM
jgi:hemolysin activation/secretion protein